MATNTSKKSAPDKGKAAETKATNTKKMSTKAADRAGKSTALKKEEYVQQTLQDYTNPVIMKEAVMWVVLAACILLFISYFGIGGYLGDVVADISFGIFGFCAYAFPVLLFIAVAFLVSNRGSRLAGIKFGAAIGLYLCLCSFAALFTKQYEEVASLGGLYEDSAAYHWGGGILGGGVCHFLCPALGAVGTAIILIVVTIICVVLITQKSLMKSMKNQGKKVYQNAKESSVRRREVYQQERQRQAEQRRLDAEAVQQEVPVTHDIMRLQEPVSTKRQMRRHDVSRRAEPVKVERVAEDVKRRNIPVLLTEETTEVRPAKSGRTEIEVPVIFPVNRRDNRMERRISGVSMNTKLEGDPAAVSPEIHEIRPRTILKDEKAGVPKETEDTCYIDLDSDNVGQVESGSYDDVQVFAGKEPDMDFQIEGIVRDEEQESELSYDELIAVAHEEMDDEQEMAEETQTEEIRTEEIQTEEIQTEEIPKKKRDFGADIFRDSNGAAPSTAGTVFRAESKQDSVQKRSIRTGTENAGQERTNEADGDLSSKRNPRSSEKEIAEGIASVEAEMAKAAEAVKPEYVYPPIELLKKGSGKSMGGQETEIRQTAARLQQTLASFGVNVTIQNVSCGPSVTRYEILPEMGVKVSKIVSLSDDIKMNLAAADIRIEAPIPGKMAVGIEVPNKENSAVAFRDLIESEEFQKHPSRIAFATGKDIAGKVVVSDIAKMPHLLIAGATGSGKSVCINTLIMSILYKAHPDEVKLIMIDPKVVELSVYNGIPHLFIPVVTDPKKAAGALNWAVAEMTDRYNKFAEYGVRDLKGYNKRVEGLDGVDDPNKPKKLPQIVIIVDELADLMMVAPGEVEDAICRLAQLARACGIHLIIATQRPSVNVITGLIKANMPSRIAFSVSSGVDSRTILDMNGAEKLLGKGDMLFAPQGYPKPARVQGAFVSDEEVADVVDFLKHKNMDPSYNTEMEAQIAKVQQAGAAARGGEDSDALFADAGRFIIDKDKASIGMLQRVFKIGFNRAARIMDQLADAGVVSEEAGTKPRKILMSMEQFENYLEEN